MNTQATGFATSQQAETAFYHAFSGCDTESMTALWAQDEVICVHPGSTAIHGHDAVVRSWGYIFSGAEPPDIQVRLVSAISNETLAVHVVEEHISTGGASSAVLLATNVYRRYDTGWLMVEHHGSVVHAQSEAHTVQ